MTTRAKVRPLMLGTLFVASVLSAVAAFAADSIKGQVILGGAPVAKSTVTLWEASAAAPKQLAQAKTNDDGRFEVRAKGAHGDAILYLVASGGVPKGSRAGGDNPALVLLAVLGSNPPASVTINELTTVASAFTAARFINGGAISGNPLRTADRRRERIELRGSRDRRVGRGDSGSTQQRPYHNPCDSGHAWLAGYGVVHGGQRRLACPLLQSRNPDRRSNTQEHSRSDGRHLPRAVGGIQRTLRVV